ncbi:hypothetical protein ID866_4838 [Astraeus odoratus]|nr:hypothetical protein ID866_4838 [Astraeus odoratus]
MLPSSRVTAPQPLPSLPPSPTSEEGCSRPRVWSSSQEDPLEDLQHPSISSASKGKAKQSFDEGEQDGGDESDTIEEARSPSPAETRRVEETLKRWEIAERRRRKAARESAQIATGPSVLGDVTRRASLILSGRHPSHRGSRSGLGNHRALKSRESVDGVPLSDIDLSPHRIVHSPTPSITYDNSDKDNGPSGTSNPFIHPSEILAVSPSPPPPTLSDSRPQPGNVPNSHPALSPTNYPEKPKKATAGAGTPFPSTSATLSRNPSTVPNRNPLQPTPPPIISPPPPPEPSENKVRWWHEWLCGCGEGPDRGGDHQAARTNPFA